MGIDWKVLIAQVINFAILLFLLQKFAYRPILKVLNERREKIEDAIERSKTVDQKMAKIEALKQEVLSDARAQSQAIIKEAQEVAQRAGEEIIAQTHKKTAHIIRDSEKKIELERQKIFQDMQRDIAALVVVTVEKTVGDVLDKKSKTALVRQAVEIIKSSKS